MKLRNLAFFAILFAGCGQSVPAFAQNAQPAPETPAQIAMHDKITAAQEKDRRLYNSLRDLTEFQEYIKNREALQQLAGQYNEAGKTPAPAKTSGRVPLNPTTPAPAPSAPVGKEQK